MEVKIKMETKSIPSIDLNSSQDIAKVKEFFPYQPFSVRVDDCQSFFYYAFLGIKKEDYTPTSISDKVVEGISSISIEAIYLGSLTFYQLALFYKVTGGKALIREQSSELFKKIANAQQLCELKRKVEVDQCISGLRISGETRIFLDEIEQKLDDDITL